MYRKTSNQGFTFFELIMVIGIIAMVAGIGIPLGLNAYRTYTFDTERQIFMASVREVRNAALANFNEADHGLYVDTNNYVLFEGSSYATRDTSADRFIPRSSSINVTGATEIVFTRISGLTDEETFTLTYGTQTVNLDINDYGVIQES